MNEKLAYFLTSTKKKLLRRDLNCPSCGAEGGALVDSKFVVTSLLRCRSCQLLFRSPTTSIEENHAFYQEEYSQGFTTELPSDADLKRLISTRFGGGKSYAGYIEVLEALGIEKGRKIFDFGCSWGYGSWQLKVHGFDVESFEISRPRAKYAREKLGLHVAESMHEVKGPYDVFFTSHVLEHVPSVQATIETAFQLLRSGGLFVAFTPNGSVAFRSKKPKDWRRLWGRVHPQFLDDVYYRKQFERLATVLDSAPYKLNELSSWSRTKRDAMCLDLGGHELLLVACK